MILAGDIGGTNTTLAILSRSGATFSIEERERYRSPALSGIEEALSDFVGRTTRKVTTCCLSGAGPVREGVCTLTNLPWTIDQSRVESLLGVRTFVINDFSAICYALPLIDTHPSISAIQLSAPDGALAVSTGSVRAVIGAGTGLGTGFLTMDRDRFVAHPSEGGHSDFGPYDDEMEGLAHYLRNRFEAPPGAEQFVSGQGIENAFRYVVSSRGLENDPTISQLLAMEDPMRPGAVARAADEHGDLADVMRLFVRMYARYASSTALFFLPTAGLYLAGGIAAKNARWLSDDHLFMRTFLSSYSRRMVPVLAAIPVYLVKDYDVSLYGAANAAESLGET